MNSESRGKIGTEPDFESEEIVSNRMVELDLDGSHNGNGNGSSEMVPVKDSNRKERGHIMSNHQKVVKAREQGYTGDICPECGSMTMVRNGTCLKCNTCGSTTGCS